MDGAAGTGGRRDRGSGRRALVAAWLGLGVALAFSGCGARTSLLEGELPDESPDAGTKPKGCALGDSEACGSDVGACEKGTRRCAEDGFFGACEGGVGPAPETCNGVDDDCDGTVDDGFGVGQACDGPDTDSCLDDVMTCGGCTSGPNQIEICNGVDDDCNGVIDADCTVGDCAPTLLVTGSVSSGPGCVDFPVEAKTTGRIKYPCGGGMVTAVLGGISFAGSVKDGQVSLEGSQILGPGQTPDGCTWKMGHTIQGSVSSGTLAYSYTETLLTGGGVFCWSPCTESGTVQVQWVAGP